MKSIPKSQGLQSPPPAGGDLGGLELWQFIKEKLEANIPVELLCVLESEGSSPGRQGFKMAVAVDESFYGTIGGGIMEHKLVEKAKAMLKQNDDSVLLMRQYHDKEHSDRSGMICSGSQLIAFIPLNEIRVSYPQRVTHPNFTIEKIIASPRSTIEISPAGINISEAAALGFQYKTETDWLYTEAINQQPVIHIIGGGHISLALSELMNYLGFYIRVYDDRPELNTLQQNQFAHEKIIIPSYDELAAYCISEPNEYAVIMTVGYRTDKTAVKQLLDKPFFYLGLLGSDHKISVLLRELEEEGISSEALKKIHTPIGINIFSKTTKEIAVSIAAEIIREKNKGLPTGRVDL
jgi:xanthine dehydrogenase accessory factor